MAKTAKRSSARVTKKAGKSEAKTKVAARTAKPAPAKKSAPAKAVPKTKLIKKPKQVARPKAAAAPKAAKKAPAPKPAPAPKKAEPAKEPKADSGPKGYTKDQYEKYKGEVARLDKFSNSQLKEMLKKNMQSMSGNKDEMIAKIADGIVLGRIPRCPSCFGGR